MIHQTFEANLQEGTGQVTGFAFPFDTYEHGTIRHVGTFPVRFLLGVEAYSYVGRVPTLFPRLLPNERDLP